VAAPSVISTTGYKMMEAQLTKLREHRCL